MNEAGKRFIGEHDFRNFCKVLSSFLSIYKELVIFHINDAFLICRWMLEIMSPRFVEIFYLLMFKDLVILG